MTVKVVVVDSQVDVVLDDSSVVVELGDSGPQGPPGPRGSQLLSGDIDPTISVGLVGDQYLNTASLTLFGPKTASGWGVGVGLLDPELQGQVYEKASPSTVWNIIHTLEFVPNVIIVDSEGIVVEGDYEYVSDNEIIATFSEPISGKAYLS
jgi:hypothetical protein